MDLPPTGNHCVNSESCMHKGMRLFSERSLQHGSSSWLGSCDVQAQRQAMKGRHQACNGGTSCLVVRILRLQSGVESWVWGMYTPSTTSILEQSQPGVGSWVWKPGVGNAHLPHNVNLGAEPASRGVAQKLVLWEWEGRRHVGLAPARLQVQPQRAFVEFKVRSSGRVSVGLAEEDPTRRSPAGSTGKGKAERLK